MHADHSELVHARGHGARGAPPLETELRLALMRAELEADLDGRIFLRAVRDTDGNIVDFDCVEANPVACDSLGLRRDDILRQRFTTLFPTAVESGRMAEYVEVVNSGEPLAWRARPVGTNRLGEGERYLDARITKVMDGVSYAFRDVTEHVRTQRALAASEASLRLVTENSADVVTLGDADGVLSYVSPAVTRILGWSQADVIHRAVPTLLHPDDRETFAGLSERLKAGSTTVVLGRFLHKDGHYVWIEAAVAPITDSTGALVGRTGVWRDMSERVAMERALAESEARYRLLTENASGAVFSASPEGVFTYMSPAVERLLGWAPDAFVGTAPLGWVHPDDAPRLVEHMRNVAQKKNVSVRLRFRTVDGDHRWIGVLVHPVLDESGALAARVGSFRDAQAEVTAELQLVAEREALRAQLDSEIEPHISLMAVRDEAGRIVDFRHVDANPAALAYLGMSRDEFLAASLLAMCPGQPATVMRDLYAHTVDSGEPLIEDAFFCPNGWFGGEDRWYDFRGAKLGDGLSLSWRDVTQKVRVQRELAASEERYRLLAENAADIVIMLDVDGITRWISPSVQGAFDCPPEEWIGRPGHDLLHPDDQHVFFESMDVTRAGESRVVRARHRSPRGEEHWVEAHVRPHLDAHGTITGMVAAYRVIDDLLEIEAELDHRARFDMLTGLLNRSEILHRVDRLATQTARTGTQTAVLFCDVDRFKDINDEYGHAAGDEVLRTIGERVSATIRADDYAARVGGDELLIVLDGVHSLDEATVLAEKIREAASQRIALEDGIDINPMMSVGVTLLRSGEGPDALIERADDAMYLAKKAGRNRVIAID